jgi:hypothetical protein
MVARFIQALFETPACVACHEQEATRGLLCVNCHQDDMRSRAAQSESFPSDRSDGDCDHDYELETVGGVFLTGAYVCRLCSDRVGMSYEQYHRHASYPRHYQEGGNTLDSEPASSNEKQATRGL